MTTKSITQTLAEWVVQARYEDIPAIGVDRMKERTIDSLGVMIGGMSIPTGQNLARWVRAQGSRPEASLIGCGFKTTASLAALANGAAGHALEFDDTSTFSGHYAAPLTAAALAVGEKVGASGRETILAWMVGWNVIAHTSRISMALGGPTLLLKGWFNQGFQSTLGMAAMSAKLMKMDVRQTRMALGSAANGMAGVMKNRASDAKSFVAGNAAMHGVMAAEMVALGCTASEDILDGEDGVARMVGAPGVDINKVLDGLGTWDLAANSSSLKPYACCAAGHWSQDALRLILERRPTRPEEIEAIEVEINDYLLPNMPFTQPQTGLQGKYSLEYDLVAIALDGRAGMFQYTDAMVRRPEAQGLMKRVTRLPQPGTGRPESRVVLKLKSGEILEETVKISHGTPGDPLSDQEVLDKFHECAGTLLSPAARARVLDLCNRLDGLERVGDLAEALSGADQDVRAMAPAE